MVLLLKISNKSTKFFGDYLIYILNPSLNLWKSMVSKLGNILMPQFLSIDKSLNKKINRMMISQISNKFKLTSMSQKT